MAKTRKKTTQQAPAPLVAQGQPVTWWFVFKFNAASYPGCGGQAPRQCPFGGEVQDYAEFGQQYVYASDQNAKLQKGEGCLGATLGDPVGATFDQVYNGSYFYVLWNDQFYGDPMSSRESPWGHSKGMVAWNGSGEGFAMQVSTPDWPAAGSAEYPRKTDGNTLGCIAGDDDIEVSQHFFALKLTKDDLVAVLQALKNASVVTDPGNRQIVNNGGPDDVQALVQSLGKRTRGKTYSKTRLSTGVELISKPSALWVPPWQMVSAALDGVPLRVASWWSHPQIYSTTAATEIGCWDDRLGKPGPVQIATSGKWGRKTLGLIGESSPEGNHAKIGVSTQADQPYAIFGDMNQQGTLSPIAGRDQPCASSQNGRGGTFYVVNDKTLAAGIAKLIAGDSAPTSAPKKAAKKAAGTKKVAPTKAKAPTKTKAKTKAKASAKAKAKKPTKAKAKVQAKTKAKAGTKAKAPAKAKAKKPTKAKVQAKTKAKAGTKAKAPAKAKVKAKAKTGTKAKVQAKTKAKAKAK